MVAINDSLFTEFGHFVVHPTTLDGVQVEVGDAHALFVAHAYSTRLLEDTSVEHEFSTVDTGANSTANVGD